MLMIKTSSVGSFVSNDYRTATVFQKYGIDFCCKGGRTIQEVCESKDINADHLLTELTEVSKINGSDRTDFKTWTLDVLADYIVKNHHGYIDNATPVLLQFLDKLCKVHGGNHPELFKINEEFKSSASELAMHMKREELVLFPYIKGMVDSKNKGEKLALPVFGSVMNPIQMMKHEHVIEGDRFMEIASLTNQYKAPADGCTTYRVAFALLKEFETDLHLHIHLENNMLFPKAIEMEHEFDS
jgi:regulator of cell morphogenesis and NO signaling